MTTKPAMHRRTLMKIAAAALCAPVAASVAQLPPRPVHWTGQVMGALAEMTLYHEDPQAARVLIGECLAEIERLETIFSLFRPDSSLRQLNRDGRLDNAPPDLLAVMRTAQTLASLSDGAFDVTVQPLWDLYWGHFQAVGPDGSGPQTERIAEATQRIGWQNIAVDGDTITLTRPGMGVTLNSIARGYATDRVTTLLKQAGLKHVLVNLDNFHGVGGHPDGSPWHLGVADPRHPETMLTRLDIRDQAVASASGYGTMFDHQGRYHHIFDPHSGGCAQNWAGCTVIAPTATLADALSTALLVVAPDLAHDLLTKAGGTTAYMIDNSGGMIVLS